MSRCFLRVFAGLLALSLSISLYSASMAYAAPVAPVISGPTAVSFIQHPLGFRGAIGWEPVDTATEYRVYDADTSALISTVTTSTHMVYGLQGIAYRRYVVAVDAGGETSPPSNTLEIQAVAPFAPGPPAGLKPLPSAVFDLQTSAAPAGLVAVEVEYDPTEVEGDPADLRLLHFTGGNWVDITTSVNTTESVVLGQTSGFSVLAVMEPAEASEFTITPSAGANGAISPDTTQTVGSGSDSATFTITPDAGFHVEDVRVDGVSVGPVSSYKFVNVVADHSIVASFSRDPVVAALVGYPGAAYLAGTTKIDFSALPDWSEVPSVSDGFLGVTFGRDMIKLTAGDTAGPRWGEPGLVEEPYPAVLFTDFNTSISIQLSSPVYEFGFEAGPSAIDVPVAFTVSFVIMRDGYVVDTISRTITGPPETWNARLFAVRSDVPFDEVLVVNDNFAGFAIAQLRYSASPPASDYTVTFESNGGTGVDPQTLAFGSLVAEPIDPTRTGHAFGGWFADAGLTVPWDFATDELADDTTLYAKWTANEYAVSFDSGGGTIVGPQTLAFGSLVIEPVDPTRIGHTFGGWYSDAALTVPWDFATDTVAGDTTLYAKWTAIDCTVSFESDGGTAVGAQVIAFGSLVIEPVDPARTGHAFEAWYSDAALTTAWDFATDTVAGDTTLYAKWTANDYTVTFDSNGGTSVGAQVVAFGSLVATPAPDPIRTGHTFGGWYSDAALITGWDFATDIVTGDTTLYAKWTANDYTVTFESNGGTTVGSQVLAFGSLVAEPVDPTRAGHTFAGWFADAGLTVPWDFATDTVAGDTILYAEWNANDYTVSFDSNGGSAVGSQVLAFGSLVIEPIDPTRAGHTFAGWYSDPGLTVPWDFATDTVAGDTTLYAKWTANDYTVSFDSNGGTAVGAQIVAFGSVVAEPADPTRVGHAFVGWFADSGLTVPWDFATDTVAGDTTLYAKWLANGYTVSFTTNGGSAVDSRALLFGSLVATPAPDPTRTGHTFAGWFADAALTTPWDFATDTVAGDTTLYAKWTANDYAVSFDSNGGTVVDPQTLAFGSLVATPVPDPTRSGHTFAGWFADAALTVPWDFVADPVAGDTTLYAKWLVNSYRVTFQCNGGSSIASQTVAFGSLVTAPTQDPTWTGHAFDGWYSDATLTTPWDFATDTVADDTTLYAKWTATYKITGSAGAHGSLSIRGTAIVTKGSDLTVTITPAAGYGIASVKVDGVAKGVMRSYTFKNVTANHTISATFKQLTSTKFSASKKSIRRGRYVTLYARLNSATGHFSNTYVRFEVRLPGSSRYILLKKVKVSSTGRAAYRYRVLNRGTRYHRVRFIGSGTLLPAPIKSGVPLRVR